jgi:N-formylglutamate amidohydrolase
MWTIEYQSNLLVGRHRGTLPVLLTSPHDGTKKPTGVPERNGQGVPEDCDVALLGDTNTRAIATGVAQRLLDLFGEAPYVVFAEFRRRYIDANRPPECAYEVPDAKQHYDEYHGTIRSFVDEIRAENGGLGLLFDIHGTDNTPEHIFLGTGRDAATTPDRECTIARLLRVDPDAMSRRRGLRSLLTAAGYAISPPRPGDREILPGGFTVRTYGSSHADGLDAFQFEIASEVRSDPTRRADLIEHLAHAIGGLAARYAGAQTLGSSRSTDLLVGSGDQSVIGGLQRRDETGDAGLRLGGRSRSRGRVEVRHDPGVPGDLAVPDRPGVLVLYDKQGQEHYLWVDANGRLRIARDDPGQDSQTGIVVGQQT